MHRVKASTSSRLLSSRSKLENGTDIDDIVDEADDDERAASVPSPVSTRSLGSLGGEEVPATVASKRIDTYLLQSNALPCEEKDGVDAPNATSSTSSTRQTKDAAVP